MLWFPYEKCLIIGLLLMDPTIHTYLIELLHDAGQTDLGPELEETLVQDLATRLEDRLVLVCAQYLSEQQQEEVKHMHGTDEAIAYLRGAVPDFDTVVAEALVDFREVYISASKGE